MQKVIKPGRFEVKMWLNQLDEGTLRQVTNLSNFPFVFKHIALMPDAHSGYGMPIGAVLPSSEVVVPNAVGVDIGCGMCVVPTNISAKALSKRVLTAITEDVKSCVPVGFKRHKTEVDPSFMPQDYDVDRMQIVRQEYSSALTQLGTLGSGNHFIEIQKDSTQQVWLMIHSGSRNIGYKVAAHYNQTAKSINKKMGCKVPPQYDLAYLPIDHDGARKYFDEMNYCVDFALANRKLIMKRLKEVVSSHFADATFGSLINIAHNYASYEMHFGRRVLVHRKGATSAKKNEKGIIPGSQGTQSYIVEGLGNPDSFMSCSHGAGRLMSRTQAVKNLNLKEEVEKLNSKGIIHGIKSKKNLDEAPSAYKNITDVMALQSNLVKVINELFPLAVIKG